MELDRFTLGVIALISLQAIQLARTVVLERVVKKTLRPPPMMRGTPVTFDTDETPSKRVRARRGQHGADD